MNVREEQGSGFEPGGRTSWGAQDPRGELRFENDVAFLGMYRKKSDDAGLVKLVRSLPSYYLPGKVECGGALEEIVGVVQRRFGSFLLLEVESGEGDCFRVTGPVGRLKPELDVFERHLQKVPRRNQQFGWRLERSEGVAGDLVLEELGAVVMRLEVPTVFRGPEGGIYPVFFRRFRAAFAVAIQHLVFEFLRLQTTSGMATFGSLGSREIRECSREIDAGLTRISQAYRLLLLVAPTNLAEIEETFFASGFQTVPQYQYRLLPVDPDLLKRELYQLRLEEIDDPAMSFLFHEKREEIDHELTMLGERGTRNFFYTSVRRYRGVTPETKQAAGEILEVLKEPEGRPVERKFGALDFAAYAEEEFQRFREIEPDFRSKVHVRDDVNVLMVSQGELFVPASSRYSEQEVAALIQHEIGTHVLTYYNGSRQPLELFAEGFADYDPLQEGLAVLAEYFAGALSLDRLRTLAGRVVGGECLLAGADFQETFRCLSDQWGFHEREAFRITVRMFQGGGFLKDIIYLDGLVKLRSHLMEGGDLPLLLAGKFGLKHISLIAEFMERGILRPPALLPKYLTHPLFRQRLVNLREGLPLHKLHLP